ncbi:MAG: molybdopterin-synthase adenylyltransferase MoeB [Hymenobacteraceae bacterium]|nr:molybdopterin-synthase adenylyltransferase MoeB [Hymenobacteraceae bacterium]
MLSPAERRRYQRHLQLAEIGEAGQLRLRAARVLLVGAGGLGCPIIQYLVAAGVGTLGIADADRVAESNLQRQILYGPADVGQRKVEVAAREAHRLNPLVRVEPYPVRVTLANVRELVAAYDVIVDGSDNFPTRYLLNDACVSLGKPLVSGAIYKFEGQVSVFNYRGGPTYRCLFSEPPGAAEASDCDVTGVLGVLPGLVGAAQATETLKVMLDLGEVLSGRLWLFDALSFQTRTLRFRRHEARSQLNLDTADPAAYADLCAPSSPANSNAIPIATTITAAALHQELASAAPPFLLDVREPNEFALCQLPGATLVPLGEIARAATLLPRDRSVVVYCHHGIRSAHAIGRLQQAGFTNLRNLTGGIHAWAETMEPTMLKY